MLTPITAGVFVVLIVVIAASRRRHEPRKDD